MFFEDLNFLNLPAVRFKRPKYETLESFYAAIFKKFKTDEENGMIWRQIASRALMVDDKDFVKELEKEGGKITFIDQIIDQLIDNYMLVGGIQEEDAMLYKNTILKGGYIKEIEFKHNPEQIVFKSRIGTFKATKLSDVMLWFKDFPNIETRERHCKCHSSSIMVSNSIDDRHKIATGYVYEFGEGSKYLHSWIELKIDGRDFVIDTTRNLLIPKKFYYYIRNIKGTVYKISGDTLKKEYHIIEYLTNHNPWLSKLYLSNRHQALQVYKILKEEEERKQLEDPLYAAAKHFREAMVKAQNEEIKRQKKNKQVKKKETYSLEMQFESEMQ